MDSIEREFKKHFGELGGELCEELAACLDASGMVPMIKHELVHTMHWPQINAQLNKQLKAKRADLQRAVSQRKWSQAIWIHERPYRLDAFLKYCHKMTAPEYSFNLMEVWQDSEHPSVNERVWLNLFTRPDFVQMYAMEPDDYDTFLEQWAYVTIYRGCSEEGVYGMSWTLDVEVATFFAGRWKDPDAKVWKTTIARRDIFAYTNQRSEREVIIHPHSLNNPVEYGT